MPGGRRLKWILESKSTWQNQSHVFFLVMTGTLSRCESNVMKRFLPHMLTSTHQLMSTFRIVGSVHDPDSYFTRHIVNVSVCLFSCLYCSHIYCLQRIKKVDANVTLSFEGVLELEFQEFIDDLKKEKSGDLLDYSFCHICLRDDKIIGSLMDVVEIAITEFGIEDAEIANTMQFAKEAIVKTSDALKRNGRPAVYLELYQYSTTGREDELFGKLVVELFEDICPKACSNFMKLCTGEAGQADGVALNYANCPLHRLVPGGWVQGGDVVDGSGKHSTSVFGEPFEDESFSVQFGERRGGIVGYSSSGPHSNGSQFFVTLGPCEWMDCTKVGFGRLVQGYDILKKLNSAPSKNQRPSPAIFIGACGVMS